MKNILFVIIAIMFTNCTRNSVSSSDEGNNKKDNSLIVITAVEEPDDKRLPDMIATTFFIEDGKERKFFDGDTVSRSYACLNEKQTKVVYTRYQCFVPQLYLDFYEDAGIYIAPVDESEEEVFIASNDSTFYHTPVWVRDEGIAVLEYTALEEKDLFEFVAYDMSKEIVYRKEVGFYYSLLISPDKKHIIGYGEEGFIVYRIDKKKLYEYPMDMPEDQLPIFYDKLMVLRNAHTGEVVYDLKKHKIIQASNRDNEKWLLYKDPNQHIYLHHESWSFRHIVDGEEVNKIPYLKGVSFSGSLGYFNNGFMYVQGTSGNDDENIYEVNFNTSEVTELTKYSNKNFFIVHKGIYRKL